MVAQYLAVAMRAKPRPCSLPLNYKAMEIRFGFLFGRGDLHMGVPYGFGEGGIWSAICCTLPVYVPMSVCLCVWLVVRVC